MKIGVVHDYLNSGGGAESVCMTICDTLEEDHTVELITLENPDISYLNEQFNTSVSKTSVKIPSKQIISLNNLLDFIEQLSSKSLLVLKKSIFYQYIKYIESNYDLMFVTKGEINLSTDSIHYIHCPKDALGSEGYKRTIPIQVEDDSVKRLYHKICSRIAGYSTEQMGNQLVLANSKWTKELTDTLYMTDSKVVYPPIETENNQKVPWIEREEGFVMIGRITPDKRIMESIEVIEWLNSRGHNVHLHIIGAENDLPYCREVRKKSDQLDYVFLEGRVPREKLLKIMRCHKYGIHMKSPEPFGMVVAEMVSSGIIPFVPRSGGQKEILNNKLLTFGNISEAKSCIESILSDKKIQKEIRTDLSVERFSKRNFEKEINKYVDMVRTKSKM